MALVRPASPLSRMPGAGRATLPRVPLLLHPPADSLAAALSLSAQCPSPLGQPVAVVVAVDAPRRAAPVFLILAHPRDYSLESGAGALSAALRGVRRRCWAYRLRQDRDEQRDRFRQPCLRPLPPP